MSTWNIHPGEILREEFLIPHGLTAYALAKAIHVPAPKVYDIVAEKRGISVDTALRLAKFFGTSVDLWLNMQKTYEMKIKEEELEDTLNAIETISADTKH